MTTLSKKGGVEIDLDKVEQLAAQGLTNAQISDCLGIGERTLYRHKSESAELADAIKRGRAKGIAFVSNKLFDQCKNGNITAIIFFLKARAGWRDRDAIEIHHGDTPTAINFVRGKAKDDGTDTDPTAV